MKTCISPPGIFSIIIERWQTNNNLEESRKRISKLSTKFQQFFNNLPIGVELYDAEGNLIDINDADTKNLRQFPPQLFRSQPVQESGRSGENS